MWAKVSELVVAGKVLACSRVKSKRGLNPMLAKNKETLVVSLTALFPENSAIGSHSA